MGLFIIQSEEIKLDIGLRLIELKGTVGPWWRDALS